ncbi:MAG: endonuclease III domain-containing protein [Pseudomonadota bacterium]
MQANLLIKASPKEAIPAIYSLLFSTFGPRYWWPAESRFEVIVGAFLTQNTSWRNVEKSIANLKAHNALSSEKLYLFPEEELAQLIRSSGYYNIKARRLKSFIGFLYNQYDGSLDKLFRNDMATLRMELLGIKGIGPETADSIILYAAEKPSFVVDAYTKRILSRHGLIKEDASYDMVRDLFMRILPQDVEMYNEYHALIVYLGNTLCMKRAPRCEDCPLAIFMKSR